MTTSDPSGAAKDLLLSLSRVALDDEARDASERILAGEVDWGVVIDQGHRHGILALVASHLIYGDLSRGKKSLPIHRLLVHVYEANRLRNHSLFRELRLISSALSRACVWHAVRKGPVLIAEIYRDLGTRVMSDIDLLVDVADYASVSEVLEANGYRAGSASADRRTVVAPSRRDEIARRMSSNNAVPMRKPSSDPFLDVFIVDVCHDLFLPSATPTVPAAVVREMTRTVRLTEFDVTALDVEAFLLDLCAHLHKEAKAFAYINLGRDLQLKKFIDVAEFVSRRTIDADRLEQLTSAWQASSVVGDALAATNRVLPGRVPPALLSRFAGDGELQSYGELDGAPRRWDKPLRERLFDNRRGHDVPATRAPDL